MSASFKIELHPEVETDYNEAYHWYELKQAGLGERFLLSVRNLLDFIKTSPEAYSSKSRKRYREAKVKDFPYLIVYVIYAKEKAIFVSAIHHQKMNPDRKYRK